MKGNLYAALLNYLAFTKKEPIFIHPKLQEEIYVKFQFKIFNSIFFSTFSGELKKLMINKTN